jgi:hypothetical protein
MTVKVAPEFWVNQGPATDIEANKLRTTAAAFRRMADGLLASRQGVVFTRGSCQDLAVLATATPNVNITIKAGACYVRGTQTADQGMYHVYNDADIVIALLTNNPANATNPRIDLVVARMQDQFYSGATDLPTIEMVTGTPAASPAVPAAPANSLILAQILIPAASTTVTQANITDQRVAAGNQPVVLDDIVIGTGSRYPVATQPIKFLNPAGGGTLLLPSGFRGFRIEWSARSSGAVLSQTCNLIFNNDNAANYDYAERFFQGTTSSNQDWIGLSWISCGGFPGASAPAGFFNSGVVWIPNCSASIPHQVLAETSWCEANTTGNIKSSDHRGHWRTAAPITSIAMYPSPGTNFVVGSSFTLIGIPY